MRCTRLLPVVALSFFVLGSVAFPAVHASGPESLGSTNETLVVSSSGDNCSGTLVYNHDDSFENGYCWTSTQEPYGGAFGEAFDIGPVNVECAAYWLTQTGNYYIQRTDLYIWAGGISGEPGEVLYVATNHLFDPPPAIWPEISQHDVEIVEYINEAEFTVGLWADLGVEPCSWYIAVDEDGPEGHPWTNVAPGVGYPTGWQHPAVIWGVTSSLGIGFYWGPFSPIESETWGRVKRLFR